MASGLLNIDRLARQALASGNLDGAEKLIGEALRQDPNDTEALSLKSAAAKRKQGGAATAGAAAIAPPKAVAGKGNRLRKNRHPEGSEGSCAGVPATEILRCAQDDRCFAGP